jgi:signal peptidase I
MGVFIVLIILSSYVVTIYRVDGDSMLPTFNNGQVLPVLIVSGQSYRTNDIVVLEYLGETSIKFVKRITAVPGDTVLYRGESLTLEDDQYFVEGDNREFSTDSRTYGPISKGQLLGKVLWMKTSYPGL